MGGGATFTFGYGTTTGNGASVFTFSTAMSEAVVPTWSPHRMPVAV
jgi:hypothetical protein